jgi:hypothetical protein
MGKVKTAMRNIWQHHILSDEYQQLCSLDLDALLTGLTSDRKFFLYKGIS